jgi:hypothetical protein
MPTVNPTLHWRWATGNHVGSAKPNQVVKIQRGVIDRHYATYQFLDGSTEDFGLIGNGHNAKPWHAYWRVLGDWITVPNVSEVRLDKGFDDNGVGSATITIQNILYQRAITTYGALTTWRRGGYSPWVGFQNFGRPFLETKTDWYDVLNGGYMVKVFQGYGDTLEPVFVGLIDDTDVNVTPDEVTLTSRSFGQLLTDQRVFGSNKAKEVRSPIIFADRLKATDITKISSGASASSSYHQHFASSVTKKDSSFWMSAGRSSPNLTEWIELHVPKGRYEDIYVDPHYAGMECYISVFVRGKSPQINGQKVQPNTWVYIPDQSGIVPGNTAADGGNGGHPYVRKIASLKTGGQKRSIGCVVEAGDNTVIRLSFRNLHRGGADSDNLHYHAGVRRLVTYKQKLKPEAKKNHWILVDDAADVVKWALMWAGFHEWEIESFGARLKNNKVFHQAEFLIDIIKWVESQADYRFYIGRPTNHDLSIGVPIFRHTRATTAAQPDMIEVRDSNILTNIERKFSKEPLATIIRVRGHMAAKKKGGVGLGEDHTRRYTATYFPPWSGAHRNLASGQMDDIFTGRTGGVVKHVTHSDNKLTSEDDCMMAAILIAVQELLAADTGTVEIPGHPGIDLDDQISVLDKASGTNSRMWVASTSSTFTSGPEGAWTMSIGGSMIDSLDMLGLAYDYLTLASVVNDGE